MSSPEAQLEQARSRLSVGAPVDATQLPERAARALSVAAAAGAPALPALDAAVAAADDARRREQAVRVASAQARAVMVGLVALPVVAVPGLSALTGMPLWRFYLTPAGVAVGLAGAALALLGVLVARRMVASVARVPPRSVDEVPELLAAALGGGLSHGAALRLVADHVAAHAPALRRAALAVDLGRAALLPAPLDRVGDVLAVSTAWGAPAAPALRRVAAQLRAEELARALEAAERLPALLTFPTALCLLPACLLLAGAPLLAEGLRAATG